MNSWPHDLANGSLVNPSLQPDPAAIAAAVVFCRGTRHGAAARRPGRNPAPQHIRPAQRHDRLEFRGRRRHGPQDSVLQGREKPRARDIVSAFVRDGRVEVILQDTKNTWTLKTEAGSIRPGTSYHVAVTFGSGGFRLFLDGELVAWKNNVTTGLTANERNLVIGANTWLRDKYNPTWTGDYFDGTIAGLHHLQPRAQPSGGGLHCPGWRQHPPTARRAPGSIGSWTSFTPIPDCTGMRPPATSLRVRGTPMP